MARAEEDGIVVLVDDEKARLVCSDVLAREGHRGIFVSREEEALVILEQGVLPLFIIELPGSAGEDRMKLLSTLAQRGRMERMMVVAVTPPGLGDLRQRALETGVSDFLSTPVDAIELGCRVRSSLELRHSRAVGGVLHRYRDVRHYREIIDLIAEGIGTVDSDGRLTFVNPKAAEMFGYAVDEMVGRHLADFASDEHARHLVHDALERIREGTVDLHEFSVRRKDGTQFWVMTTSRALYVGGRYAGAVGTVHDITDRHKAQEALRSSEQRLSLAMVAADLGLWDWNLVADTAHLSPEYQQLLGLEEAEIHNAGAWFRDQVHPDDVGTAWKTVEEHLQGKTPQSVIEYRARRGSGEYVWLRGIGRVVAREPTGAPTRMTGVIVDISEQKRTEDMLRAAIDVRDNVLAMVSHDLRNPLTAITLSASLLIDESREHDRRRSRKQLELILQSADHMQRLIERVLDAATIEAGTFTLDYSREEVSPMVDELFQEFEPIATPKSIRLIHEVPEALPTITCDRTRVQQVLSNLIGNALKVVPAHGMIRVRVWVQADEMHFEVADSGPGIPEQILPHLFERYWTGDPGRRRGIGLGLFISKGIIEAHGGQIVIESEIGHGTRFHFTLPVSPAAMETAAQVHVH